MGPRGFGPLTPVLSGLCSNQLSYGPKFLNRIAHSEHLLTNPDGGAPIRAFHRDPESESLKTLASGLSYGPNLCVISNV